MSFLNIFSTTPLIRLDDTDFRNVKNVLLPRFVIILYLSEFNLLTVIRDVIFVRNVSLKIKF